MRRRFRFRLARLLRVRAIEERVARGEWSRAETAARESEARRAERARDLGEARGALFRSLAPGAGPLRPTLVLRTQLSVGALLDALRRSHEDALTRRARAESSASLWRARERDRRVLAELQDRARVRHREELERHDNALLDEQALMRQAYRKSRSREEDSSSGAPASDETGKSPAPAHR